MALTISQIVAASYPAVLAEMKRPANQWAESAFLNELEKQGGIKRMSFGAKTIEAPIDWQRNPGAEFLATDMQSTSLTKTDVISAASYSVAELSVPIVWSKADDASTPSENQKIAFVRSLLENAINSHDDRIEAALFGTSTNNFLGLQTILPTSGQGNVGGIDAAVEVSWRNYADTYQAAGTDLEAEMTVAHNTASKGTGSNLMPTLVVSGRTAHSLYEGGLQALQRFIDSTEARGGYKKLAFKNATYVFSQYGETLGTNPVYFINPKSFQLCVSKEYFRDKGKEQEIPNANGFVSKVYSALGFVTNNKSRGAVIINTE